mgnify:CR=1 FL=1
MGSAPDWLINTFGVVAGLCSMTSFIPQIMKIMRERDASGVSLLLELAKYYAAHPQPYSIAFAFFGGEEAGLIGSKYFVEQIGRAHV